MILYNLSIFASIRDLAYLYYALFILMLGLSTFAWDGLHGGSI